MPKTFLKAFILAFLVAAALSGCATVGSEYPKPAPEFKAKLLNGDVVTLADFKGRPLVIGIGATWCPHCMKEAPIFRQVHDHFGDRVGMMGVLMKSTRADVDELVKKAKINFMIAFDPDAEVAKDFGVRGIPRIFFIDKNGMIVDDVFGGIAEDDMIKKIDNMLAR